MIDTSHHRPELLNLIAESSLFTEYRQAFQIATGFNLRLGKPASKELSFLPFANELSQPVTIGGRDVTQIVIGPFRMKDGEFSSFEACAHRMLDDGSDANDIREARRHYQEIPAITSAEATAFETMLRFFAIQLSQHAEQLFLMETESEPHSVRKARNYILHHLNESLSLDEVSSHAGVSPFHFCKIFKRATGLTFTEFVNRARIEQAKRLLLKPQSRITEIAYDVGFQSLSQFNRSFRRMVSISPTEYRQKTMEKTRKTVGV